MKIECNAFDVGASVNLFDLYDFINGVLCSNLHINDYDTQVLTQTLVILKQSVLNSMPELDSNELKLLEENKMNAWAAYHQRTGFPKSWTGLKVKEIFEKCNLKEK